MYKMIRSDIYRRDDGSLDIDYYNQNHGGISTRRGRNKRNDPYVTHDALLNGHTVYSVYCFSGDDYVSIFKDIKQGNWNIESYSEWIDFTARYIVEHILRHDMPDILVIPESSSNLVVDLAKSVSKYAKLSYLPHAFIKNPVDKITLNISEDDPGYQSVMKVLTRIRQNGSFEAKLVPKRMLKFFKDIYTNDDKYANMLEGQKVVVLDDSITSKATMSNIFDVCDYLYGTSEAYGITIFKKTGSSRR